MIKSVEAVVDKNDGRNFNLTIIKRMVYLCNFSVCLLMLFVKQVPFGHTLSLKKVNTPENKLGSMWLVQPIQGGDKEDTM